VLDSIQFHCFADSILSDTRNKARYALYELLPHRHVAALPLGFGYSVGPLPFLHLLQDDSRVASGVTCHQRHRAAAAASGYRTGGLRIALRHRAPSSVLQAADHSWALHQFLFVLATAADVAVCRPLTRWWLQRNAAPGSAPPSHRTVKKTGWFLLHSCFICLVVASSYDEAWAAFLNPVRNGYLPANGWGTNPGSLFGAIAIGGFHLHHLITYRELLTTEDVVHHLPTPGP
jgi:hypothetical protein